MKHLSEEEIVLHCYGDVDPADKADGHLRECLVCRSEFERMRELLHMIGPFEVSEPPAGFEQRVWLNLRDRLPEKQIPSRWWLVSPPRWTVAGAVTVLVVVAFLAGRYASWRSLPAAPGQANRGNPQKVVLVAVSDHLERSQMLLVEIMNNDANDAAIFSAEQKQARDLLDANHLYRVSAQRTGDPQVGKLLDELGRVLTEIADSPSGLNAADLEQIRGRIQSEGLLFKVRVVGSEMNTRVRRQEEQPAAHTNQRL
jgi:hypothetical protein